MFVIEVIPLTKSPLHDTLSYFSSTAYPIGALVRIPIRNREIHGVVIKSETVSATRAALRAATFSLRKLDVQTAYTALSPQLIETARELATRYVGTVGTILFHLLPPEIRSGEIAPPHTHHVTVSETHTPETILAHREDRFLTYRSLAREVFAHSGSLLCVVPSSIEADTLFSLLSPGIEDRIILLSSTRTKREMRQAFETLADFSKSKLIIATPSYAVIERHDITTVVIEHARSPFYKDRERPYLDMRDVLKIHARITGRRIIFGDLLLRSEEEAYRREDLYHTIGPIPKRIDLPGILSVVSMATGTERGTPFKLFSDEVLTALKDERKKKGRVFLFAARRGLAPVVSCVDCGHIFRSPESGAPFSLLRMKKGEVEERWFVCSVSGHRERAADTCPACGSWRLRERGIGIQHVHDELSSILQDPVILFDHITASTYKKAKFLRDRFYSTKGAVMIGTHMALPYLTHPITMSAIVNMDALYATPTWRLQEENLALLLALREVTHGTVFVQTRTTPDDTLLRHARHGTIEQFYTEELELRKTFNYPPFTVFIHLTWQGTPEETRAVEKRVQETLAAYTPSFYTAPPTGGTVVTAYCLVRVAATDWPLEKLRLALGTLPPSIRIVINPDRIV